MRIGEGMLLAVYLHVHYIARRSVRYKNHKFAFALCRESAASERLSLGGDGGYFKSLEEGQRFLLSSHG